MKHFSNLELLAKTLIAAKSEYSATLKLLEYLSLVHARKAYERISAMRLVDQVPEVRVHLESGALNLTNAAQIHRFAKVEKIEAASRVEERSEERRVGKEC